MTSRVRLLVVASLLAGAAPAHAGRLDALRVLKQRLEQLQGKRKGKVEGLGIGPQHSYDTKELRASTMRMTSRQFRIGKGGKIVAVRTLFTALRPSKVEVQSVEDFEDETRRVAYAAPEHQLTREVMHFDRVDGQRIWLTHGPMQRLGERVGHKLNRLRSLFADSGAARANAEHMQITVAELRMNTAGLTAFIP